MTFPPSLLAPAPRPVAQIEPFLRKSSKLALGMITAGAVIVPIAAVLLWVDTGALDVTVIAFACGIGALISSLGAVLLARQRTVRRLLTDGSVVLARVRQVTVSDVVGGNARMTVDLEQGSRRFTVEWVGRSSELTVKEGDSLPLFELQGQHAVCTPELGAVLVSAR